MTGSQRNRVRLVAASWLAVACGVSGQQAPASTGQPAPAVAEPPAPSVVCLAPVDGSVRVYRLHQVERAAGQGREWRLTMTDPASKRPPLAIDLRGAVPAVAAPNARLEYRSANGGVVVTLDSTPAAASLEVYVNYELEVNVDATLTPDVDRLSTHGAVRLPPCRIDAS